MNRRSPQKKEAARISTPGAPSRRQREKEIHRGEILDAAERVFVSRGFDQATMDEIAHAAGFSTGAIYNFFQSKDELCLQVLRRIFEDFISVFKQTILTIDDPLNAICSHVELRLRHIHEHGPFLKMLHESRSSGGLSHEAFRKECGELIHVYVGNLSALFARAMVAGVLKKMDPTYAALAMEGVILTFSMHWDRTGGGPEAIESRVEIVRKNYLDHIIETKRKTSR